MRAKRWDKRMMYVVFCGRRHPNTVMYAGPDEEHAKRIAKSFRTRIRVYWLDDSGER